MARDAIARQYDVDKNSVTLSCDEGKGGYRPGTIVFHAKKGRSIDLNKVRDSIAATRLSGGTNMKMDWLEITASGTVYTRSGDLMLRVSGTEQIFELGEHVEAKGVVKRLRDAQAAGAKITSVTGRIPGWNGRFPDVLKALAKDPPPSGEIRLQVMDFEVAK